MRGARGVSGVKECEGCKGVRGVRDERGMRDTKVGVRGVRGSRSTRDTRDVRGVRPTIFIISNSAEFAWGISVSENWLLAGISASEALNLSVRNCVKDLFAQGGKLMKQKNLLTDATNSVEGFSAKVLLRHH